MKRFSALINTSEYSVEPIKEIHDFLFVGDKYYSSFYNFYNLSKLGYYYVLRCKNSFCKEVITFCNSDAEEAWLTIDLTLKNRKYGSSITRINNKAERPKSVTVRCIKRILDNGELLCLITNVEDLSTKEVCDIFYTRWNEETSFDTDKNKLEVESFSSKTPNGVQHDFYSTILTANIAQLIISAAQIKVDEEQAKKDNKYQYKVNTAVAIGTG